MEYIPDVLVAPAETSTLLKPKHPLLSNQRFSKLGRNKVIACNPPLMNFHGVVPGIVQQSVLRLVNVSKKSTRVHVMGPDSDAFDIQFVKKGTLAAGVAEEITVTFSPRECTYHYDEIKIHTPDGNLLVPIHAYPVMNETQIFPRQVHLPPCEIGATVQRVVNLTCTIPMSFDFDFVILDSNPAFTVSPLKGVVPENGSVPITFSFTPLKKITAQLKMLINISQFNFKPFICTVTAVTEFQSTVNDVAQRVHAQSLRNKKKFSRRPGSRGSERPRSALSTWTEASSVSRVSFQQDGASRTPREQLYSKGLTLAKQRASLNTQSSLMSTSVHSHEKPPADRLVGPRGPVYVVQVGDDEVRLPKKVMTMPAAQLNSQYVTSFVLTQEAGKMKISELKEQLAKRRHAASQAELLEANGKAADDDGTYMSQPNTHLHFQGENSQVKEMVFNTHFNKQSSNERFLAVNPTKVKLGQQVMDSVTREGLEDERFAETCDVHAIQRDLDRASRHEKLSGERVVYVDGQRLEVSPTWDVFKNDPWAMRARALNTFVLNATKLVIRNRIDHRIKKIKEILRRNKQSKSTARMATIAETHGAHTRFHDLFSIDRVHALSFPSFSDELENRIKVEPTASPVFNFLEKESTSTPWEYKLLGFNPHPIPRVPTYVSVESARPLRSPNAEAGYVVPARGRLSDRAGLTSPVKGLTAPHGDDEKTELHSNLTTAGGLDSEVDEYSRVTTAASTKPLSKASSKATLADTVNLNSSFVSSKVSTSPGLVKLPVRFLRPPIVQPYETLRSKGSTYIPLAVDSSAGDATCPARSQPVTLTQFGLGDTLEFESLQSLEQVKVLSHLWRPAPQLAPSSVMASEFGLNFTAPMMLTPKTYKFDNTHEDKDEYEAEPVVHKDVITEEEAQQWFRTPIVKKDADVKEAPSKKKKSRGEKLSKDTGDDSGDARNSTKIFRTTKPTHDLFSAANVVDELLASAITGNVFTLTEDLRKVNRVTVNPNLLVEPSLQE